MGRALARTGLSAPRRVESLRRGDLAGIILAAGASRRMGTAKALLEYRGETFLGRIARLFSAECGRVIAVVGPDADQIRSAGAAAEFVTNPSPERGQITSLQHGLAAASGAAGALFSPVDHPAVEAATIERLAAALRSGALIALPRYNGRRGHPAAISGALFAEFLALPATASAKDVLTRHEAEIEYVDVDDPGIADDIDTPEAYRRLLESARP